MVNAATYGAADRVFERLVSGLESAFGRNAAEGLARHFIQAEDGDFYWDARERMRFLGGWESIDEDQDEALDRVVVAGVLDGRYYVAVLVMDGWDAVQGLLGVRHFEDRAVADKAFVAAH